MRNKLDSKPWLWLLIGTALLATSQLRFGIGILAWIAPVPFLRALRVTTGRKSRVAFWAWWFFAWNIAVAKLVTAPLPLAMAPLFALPVALFLGTPYMLWSWLRGRTTEARAAVAFAAASVVGEWLLHRVLPFGTWGAAANTQLDHLALLQIASVTGLHGIGFLIDFGAATVESLLDGASAARWRNFAVACGLVLVATVSGEARLAIATGAHHATSRVAAVGTDATAGGLPLPGADERKRDDDALFARTRLAARAGATLVVWTEAASVVPPNERDGWIERVRTLARETNVTIVAGFIVPISTAPLRFDNQYVYVTASGNVEHVYRKHHPVPGEPSLAGHTAAPWVDDPRVGRVSGAICYDYDFPAIARERALLDVDLVALPSSDWRGIDPIHTQMAALRAIESGHSVLRSTRFGLSAGIDPWGRTRGWLSAWDDVNRVLVVDLPRHGVRTVYGTLGDWFPWCCVVATLFVAIEAMRRRAAGRQPMVASASASTGLDGGNAGAARGM